MNSTAEYNGYLDSNNSTDGFGYGIGVSVGILMLITTIILTSYCCTRNPAGSGAEPSEKCGRSAAEPAELCCRCRA
ncbi:hypothetical protein OIU79_011891 [Salix purpurea]|uniref:Uncharacterized protein n=1 Tax=Salix purpurea TaxID=77065 RepID=A0A9Q0Q1X4_SALPP|nr:hypothetical protein OIU79_011891 [Salix purpurea]